MSATLEQSGWTFDDLADADLPLDPGRYEVVDGRLVDRPEVSTPHGDFAFELASALNVVLPAGWRARSELAVALGRNGRRADVGVFRAGVPVRRTQMGRHPGDVAMLGEVVSPGSRRTDRVLKPAEYAAAGIPAYWRFELEDELLLVVHRLVQGAYVPVQEVRGGGNVLLALGAAAVTVSLDLAALLPPLLD